MLLIVGEVGLYNAFFQIKTFLTLDMDARSENGVKCMLEKCRPRLAHVN